MTNHLYPKAPYGVIPENTDIDLWTVQEPGNTANDIPLTSILGSAGATGVSVKFQGAQADQSVVRVVPTAGQTKQIPNNCTTYLMVPAGTLATLAVEPPLAPANGQNLRVLSTQVITALTFAAAGGDANTISNTPTAMVADTSFSYTYNTADTNWYRLT